VNYYDIIITENSMEVNESIQWPPPVIQTAAEKLKSKHIIVGVYMDPAPTLI
jgi:hypothetical protein